MKTLAHILWSGILIWVLGVVVMLWRGLRCSHPHHAVSFPVHGKSTCHNCLRVREYAWDDKGWCYDVGKPRRWHRESN